MERVPEAVEEAAKSGDFSAVRAWLRTVTGDVNRYVINDPCNQKHQLSSDLSTCLRIRAPLLLVIFERLLRAGARLENSWLERRLASCEDPCYERGDTSLATNASFQEIKSIAEGVLAAGSYRAYLHEQRKQVLSLRSLANRGRAATTDPVMNFLEQLGDNGVLWNVLSHWPPPRR